MQFLVQGRFPSLIVLAAAFAWTLAMAAPAAAGSSGEIVGRVTDRTTHAVVASASVTAMSTTGTYRTVTDRNGFFSIVDAFPNTYLVSVSASTYQTTQLVGGAVNPNQATVVDVQLEKSSVYQGKTSAPSPLSIVRPGVAADRYLLTASAADSTNGSGGSYGLYQAPGIAGTLPGVTLDAGVNAHIRGSRLDEIGYEYDGVNAVNPLTGLAATNLVQDGIVRFEVNESGDPSSAATGSAGVINSVVGAGSYPAHGSLTSLIQSPTFYHGTNFSYGTATPDRRFSWFASGVLWNSGYDWGQRGTFVPGADSSETAIGDGPMGAVSPARDQVFNLHYRPGATQGDDIQLLAAAGFERFENALAVRYWPSTNPLNKPSTNAAPSNGICNNNGLALFPGQPTCTAGTGSATDHVDQSYSVQKLRLTHGTRANSSLAIQYARVESGIDASFPFGDGPFADYWETMRSVQHQFGIEYAAQLGENHFLRAGASVDNAANTMLVAFVSNKYATVTPTSSHDRTWFFSDAFRPSSKLAVEAGARYVARTYDRVSAPAFTDSGTQGQVAASYAFGAGTVVRAAYGNVVELPWVSRVERIVTNAPNFADISPANQAGVLDAQPAAAQSHTIDFSIERMLGTAAVKVTPFWRRSSDLVVAVGSSLTSSQSVGPYFVNGISAELQFLHSGNRTSGYINYTRTRALAGATGDFTQPLGIGALDAHALFPVSFVAPDVANVVLTWRHARWSVNPEINFSSGYPYGVGRFTYNSLNCSNAMPSSVGDPTQPCGAVVRNPAAYGDTIAGNCGPGACAQLLDPAESRFADGRICCASLTANLNVFYTLSQHSEIGVQWENANHNTHALALAQNPYFPASPYGAPGFNGFINYGATPYIPVATNNSEEFLFTVIQKF